MSSNFNCSYMARNSLTYIPFYSVNFSLSRYIRLCKLGILGKKITFKSSPLKPLNQIKSNLAVMVSGWVLFKIVSASPALHSIWPLLLKIDISSIGHNCSIVSQIVPKFELYKHNDELFNMYYRIFYEIWTFADFDRLSKLIKGRWNLKKSLLLWNYWANLNQTLLKWSLGGPLSKLCPSAPSCIQDGRHY